MKTIHKALIILLSAQTLMATDIQKEVKTFGDKFCKKFKTEDMEGIFCMTHTQEYPIVKSRDKVLQKNLNIAIKKNIGDLKIGKSKKYVLDTIKDGVTSAIGHEEEVSVHILSITPKTFSLEMWYSAYLGGAHGSNSTEIIDYDRETGKRIELDKLFIANYRNKLKDIVEKEFRKQEHIEPNDSLQDKLNWFENNFVLSESIGIGEDGLHLEYNSYEVKAYAGGTTSIVVNYGLLEDIIKPNGYLSPLITKPKLSINKSNSYHFFDKFLNFELQIKRIAKDKIEVNLKVISESYDVKGGVSLSFPQLKNKSSLINRKIDKFSKISVYPKGSSIYNFKTKRNIKSKYLLIEAESKKWHLNQIKNIKLTLKIPKDAQSFKINLRSTLIKDKTMLNTPYKGEIGQQGVSNYSVEVML